MLFGDISSRLTTVTVLDDYETSSTSDYDGDTGGLSILNESTLEGSHLLKVDEFAEVGHGSISISRGNKYKIRFIDESTNPGELWFLVGVQDSTNAFDDCYACLLENDDNRIRIVERNGGSSNGLDTTSVSISGSTEYRFELEYGPTGATDNLVLTLYDSNDNVLATATTTDDTHTGGTFGFYGGGGDGLKVDYVTEDVI